MADAVKTIVDHFKDNIVFINVMVNMSVDCDCVETAGKNDKMIEAYIKTN